MINMNLTQLDVNKQIVNIGMQLKKKKLIVGTWGNISSRIPDSNIIAITPSGRNYLDLTPNDIVLVNNQGRVIEGKYKPSSETQVHLSIYRERSDVQAIIHTHSIFASAFAVAGKSIPPIIEDLVQVIGGSVDVADYALPGTTELAQNVIKALQDKNAALMANHGMVGCGHSLIESMVACELVEKAAQICIYANSLGNVSTLSTEDVSLMHNFYLKEYRQY
jgi:L-ribulose-5-phosphate 4-epimerase